MGDDISLGSVTDCHLRSNSKLRRHTQQCRAAPRQQTQPKFNDYGHHPLIIQFTFNKTYLRTQLVMSISMKNKNE